MPSEGPNTPKIGAPVNGRDLSDGAIRAVKQLGVEYVLMGGGPMPWTTEQLRPMMDKLSAGGLKFGNVMISGFSNTIYGKPGRDEEIVEAQGVHRCGRQSGLPVIEYNFYAHRAMEGYYEETGRAGAGLTAFDYDRMKDLPPLPAEGAHTVDEMWENIGYFLKAVIPVAEKSNVRLALHPNDPPAPLSRGSGQIMGSVEGWKKLIDIVSTVHQRHNVRLRRYSGNGSRSGRGLPLFRLAGPNQSRALSQRACTSALQQVHGSVHRRR